MPIYRADEMVATPDVVNPNVMMKQFGGDLIKVGIVSYKEGEAPPPHSHPVSYTHLTLPTKRIV